mmetsp:Transcript_14242/g.43209  ORF Transcript_14242/g.43209 Transcript_14242/m.43209 type:complete len:339 (-) Transcript_14242:1715-2731(-)
MTTTSISCARRCAPPRAHWSGHARLDAGGVWVRQPSSSSPLKIAPTRSARSRSQNLPRTSGALRRARGHGEARRARPAASGARLRASLPAPRQDRRARKRLSMPPPPPPPRAGVSHSLREAGVRRATMRRPSLQRPRPRGGQPSRPLPPHLSSPLAPRETPAVTRLVCSGPGALRGGPATIPLHPARTHATAPQAPRRAPQGAPTLPLAASCPCPGGRSLRCRRRSAAPSRQRPALPATWTSSNAAPRRSQAPRSPMARMSKGLGRSRPPRCGRSARTTTRGEAAAGAVGAAALMCGPTHLPWQSPSPLPSPLPLRSWSSTGLERWMWHSPRSASLRA